MTEKAYAFEHGLSPVTAKLIELLRSGKVGDQLTNCSRTAVRIAARAGRVTGVSPLRYAGSKEIIVWYGAGCGGRI